MKNLLILAIPRSGSSALYQAITSNYFEYHSYFEPWGKINPVKVEGNHIVKSLIHHRKQWSDIINDYDKVIYISRRDKEAGYRSYLQAINTKNFLDKYTLDTKLKDNEVAKNFYYFIHKLLEKKAQDKIWYYEDLFYSKQEIDKLISHHQLNIRHPDRFYNFFKIQYKLQI